MGQQKQNPNDPLEPWEIREFIDTTTDFRKLMEKERAEFHDAIVAIPHIKRETERQSAALFSETESESGTGMLGLVPMAREAIIGFRWTKRALWVIGGLMTGVATLIATLIGMISKLVESGALKALL